jgi:hypothetical protein
MEQPWALEAVFCGPSKASKISRHHRKSTEFVVKVYILALNMAKKLALEPIWVAHSYLILTYLQPLPA